MQNEDVTSKNEYHFRNQHQKYVRKRTFSLKPQVGQYFVGLCYLSVDELPRIIEIEGYSVNVNFLELYRGEATMLESNPFLKIQWDGLVITMVALCLLTVTQFLLSNLKSAKCATFLIPIAEMKEVYQYLMENLFD